MSKIFVANSKIHFMEGLKVLKDQGNEIVSVTENDVDIFHTDRLMFHINQVLDSNPVSSGDYVLLSGSNIINVLLCTAILKRTGILNVLMYGAKDKLYHKRERVETLKLEEKK